MRRAIIAVTAAAVVTGAAGVIAVGRPDAGAAADTTTVATRTAQVERRDVAQIERVAGVLGYADERELLVAVAGTLTWLPDAGTVIRPGQPIAELDSEPVLVARGSVPAWRDLRVGVRRGEDVRQLEETLVELGYARPSATMPDDRFTAVTAAAVRAWQEATGARRTGELGLGSILFTDGELRVLRGLLRVGDPVSPGQPMLQVADPAREVRAALSASRSDLLAIGDAVVVEMPDGRRLEGSVRDLGRGLEPGSDGSVERSIRIAIADAAAVEGVDVAPVTIEISSLRADGVVAVPVHALRARTGGGYVVDVVRGDQRIAVPVEVGAIAEGWAEIQGEVDEGEKVVVPA